MKEKAQGTTRTQFGGSVQRMVRQNYCDETIKFIPQKFNGSIYVGGGALTCSRRATITDGRRHFCTFHAKRRGLLPNID
jgi:hypothetical protein